MADKPHYHEHRARLRQRFTERGADSLADYELVELLLFNALPRRDVKPLAKRLMDKFGGLSAMLAADPRSITEVEGAGDAVSHVIGLAGAISRRALREDVLDRPVISGWDKLIDYCTAAMAHNPTEQFRVLFLDHRNGLLADEVQQEGTINHVPLYPREVIKRALELQSSAIILVHNHPSGDPTPSDADVEMTREVMDAGRKLGVTVHDHLIICRGGHQSMKTLGLI